MARPKKTKTRDERLVEILDAAERLFYTRGYESVSVQELIDELGIAKGTFYHYFQSKGSLLEAVAEHRGTAATQGLRDAVEARGGSAVDKLRNFFALSAEWKAARKDDYVALVLSLYTDSNILFRRHLTESGLRGLAPVIASWLEQGIREGSVKPTNPSDPLGVAELILRLMSAMGERSMPLVLAAKGSPAAAAEAARWLELSAEAIERLLGVAQGSLGIFDRQLFAAAFGTL